MVIREDKASGSLKSRPMRKFVVHGDDHCLDAILKVDVPLRVKNCAIKAFLSIEIGI